MAWHACKSCKLYSIVSCLIELNLCSNLGNNSDLVIEDGALNSNVALITL
jgi:hypothetical protein